jgi:hypothetical protein
MRPFTRRSMLKASAGAVEAQAEEIRARSTEYFGV